MSYYSYLKIFFPFNLGFTITGVLNNLVVVVGDNHTHVHFHYIHVPYRHNSLIHVFVMPSSWLTSIHRLIHLSSCNISLHVFNFNFISSRATTTLPLLYTSSPYPFAYPPPKCIFTFTFV